MLYCWVFKETQVCTLKIAYQTQICKREIFYRGEPRNQRQKMSTDQNRIQIKKMFCTRINFIEKRKSKDKSSEKIRGSLQKDQAKKSVGRMPWHQEPKKDVISCEKLR